MPKEEPFAKEEPLKIGDWMDQVAKEDPDLLFVGKAIHREAVLEAVIRKAVEGRLQPLRLRPVRAMEMSRRLREAGWMMRLTEGKGSWWMPPDGGKEKRLKAAFIQLRDEEILGRRR